MVYIAPRTPVEEKMALIWSEALSNSRVGVKDNFFELGGHSLLAIRTIGKIQEEFGVGLSLRTLFQSPTLEGLSQNVEALLYLQESPVVVADDEEREDFEI